MGVKLLPRINQYSEKLFFAKARTVAPAMLRR